MTQRACATERRGQRCVRCARRNQERAPILPPHAGRVWVVPVNHTHACKASVLSAATFLRSLRGPLQSFTQESSVKSMSGGAGFAPSPVPRAFLAGGAACAALGSACCKRAVAALAAACLASRGRLGFTASGCEPSTRPLPPDSLRAAPVNLAAAAAFFCREKGSVRLELGTRALVWHVLLRPYPPRGRG